MMKMKSDASLDYAVFQLSPRRSRCELFVWSDGCTEKLASGLIMPFVSHLQIAEEQVASAAQSVKLEVGQHENAESWFTKGTLERFVRFVSTPKVLELVNSLDAEMSQLEGARRIYSQGAGDQLSGRGNSGTTSEDDATKKELLRAIDMRLVAAQQDLSSAYARAAAAGFNIHTVSQLHNFALTFGAHRLNEACIKFASLNERRPALSYPLKSEADNWALRSSYGSDMSIDDDHHAPPNPTPDVKDETSTSNQPESIQETRPSRRLSVQDRINMFENKQKENSGGKPAVLKSLELRRFSSDLSSPGAILRRWSGASDMSIDLSGEKEDGVCNPASAAAAKVLNLNDDKVSSVANPEMKVVPSSSRGCEGDLKGVSFASSEQLFDPNKITSNLGSCESDALKDQEHQKTQSRSFVNRNEDQESSEDEFKSSATGRNKSCIGFGNQGKLRGEEFTGSKTQMTGLKDQVSPSSHSRLLQIKSGEQSEFSNPWEISESRDESVKEVGLKAAQKTVAASGVLDGGPGSRIRQAFASRLKGVEGDCSSAQKEVRPVMGTEVAKRKEPRLLEKATLSLASVEVTPLGKTEIGKKKSHMSENVSNTRAYNQEDSGPQRLKFSRQVSTVELSKKARVQQDDASSGGNSGTQFSGQVTVAAQEDSDSFSTPTSQSQRMRQSKGNQELDELKMKASELEKMFAEHKLKVPGDLPNSSRNGKLGDMPREPSSSSEETKPIKVGTYKLLDNYRSTPPSRVSKNSTKKAVDSQYDNNTLNKKFSDLSVSESSPGNFYERYMQKRDAKLRDDWSANREEKEARLKSLQDSLEKNRSDMKTKIFGSANTQYYVSSAH